MSKRRVRDPKEEVTLNGKIGAFGAGIEGTSKTQELVIEEYEEILHSMRQALETYPNIPVDETILKNAGRVFNKLSDTGRRDLHYIITGEENIPVKKYKAGTQATWIVPYIEEYLSEYRKVIDARTMQSSSRLPFIQFRPIGVRIILSEYTGVRLFFMKRMDGIEFTTIDDNYGGLLIVEGQKYRIPRGNHVRIMSNHPDSEFIWALHFSSEGKDVLSPENGTIDGRKDANNDLLSLGT